MSALDPTQEKITLLASILERLGKEYHFLARYFEPPVRVPASTSFAWRFQNRSPALVCFLKGVKLVSTLNGAITLHRGGHIQEVGALARIADDCCSGIFFMLTKQGDAISESQRRYMDDFFQEEFLDPDNPLDTRQKRETVRQKTIHAALVDAVKGGTNPADLQKTQYVVHGVLSGYVHGAYPHIMEMLGGPPLEFHMNGMLNTPRMLEGLMHISTYTHRCVMATELLAKALGAKPEAEAIRGILIDTEKAVEFRPIDVQAAIAAMRSKKPQT